MEISFCIENHCTR